MKLSLEGACLAWLEAYEKKYGDKLISVERAMREIVLAKSNERLGGLMGKQLALEFVLTQWLELEGTTEMEELFVIDDIAEEIMSQPTRKKRIRQLNRVLRGDF